MKTQEGLSAYSHSIINDQKNPFNYMKLNNKSIVIPLIIPFSADSTEKCLIWQHSCTSADRTDITIPTNIWCRHLVHAMHRGSNSQPPGDHFGRNFLSDAKRLGLSCSEYRHTSLFPKTPTYNCGYLYLCLHQLSRHRVIYILDNATILDTWNSLIDDE